MWGHTLQAALGLVMELAPTSFAVWSPFLTRAGLKPRPLCGHS